MTAKVKSFVTLFSSLMLAACTNSMNLEVTTTVPKAAMEASEKRVTLILLPAFTSYVYQENSEARENWEINLGASQSGLFRSIFESAFGNVSISHSDGEFIDRLLQAPDLPADVPEVAVDDEVGRNDVHNVGKNDSAKI